MMFKEMEKEARILGVGMMSEKKKYERVIVSLIQKKRRRWELEGGFKEGAGDRGEGRWG
jgi:hypothetical protein